MRKIMCLFLFFFIALISCNGGGGSSGGVPGSSTPQRVASFTVTTGSSVVKSSMFDFFLTYAYAAGSVDKKKITYDSKDQVSVIETLNTMDITSMYNEFSYDEDGNITKEIRYVLDDADENSNGSTDDYIKYLQRDFSYYEDGTIKKIITTNYVRATGAIHSTSTATNTKNADGTLTMVLGTLTKIYYFDAEGKITKTTSTDGGASPRETQFTYDSKGRMTKQKDIQKWDDSVANEYDFTYTDDDLVKTKDNGTTTDTYTYVKESGVVNSEDAIALLTYGSVEVFGK